MDPLNRPIPPPRATGSNPTPGRLQMDPAHISKLNATLAPKVSNASSTPIAAKNQVMQNMVEHTNPETAHLTEGAANTSKKTGLKSVTIFLTTVQSKLSKIPDKVRSGFRSFSPLKDSGLGNIFSKKVSSNPGMTQRAQHRVTQQEAQGQMASAVSEKPEVAQFRRREERLKNELKPLKEIEVLKDKGLLSNDQYRDLKQALTGQQYPEAHKALNEWFAQNNWKSAPPPDLPKECFANILDYNLKGF